MTTKLAARALVLAMTISVGCDDGAASTTNDAGQTNADAATSAGADASDAGVAGDAGVVGDAGIVADARADGGTSADLCGVRGAALFCEGFESPLGSEWVVYNGSFGNGCGGHSVGVGQRDTTRSHSGAASWHANVDYIDMGSCQAELRRSITLPTPDTFVRMFVYVPAMAVAAIANSVELDMLHEAQGFGAVGATLFGGTLGADGYGDVTAPRAREATPFPTDRWVCVEWQLHQGTSPTFAAWRDDVQTIPASPVSMMLAEPLDALFFGIYGYANLGPVDVWFDDIALSASRVGCGS